MTTEPGTIDLGHLSLATDAQRLRAGRHGLAQLVRQHERGLVLHIQLAAEREHALAFHLVAEDDDRQHVGPQRQLAPGEQGAGGDREITPARLAAPARLALGSATVVDDHAAAVGTDRLAVGGGPAQPQEHVLDPAIGHPHDLGSAERARRRRKQKVLRHDDPAERTSSASFLAQAGV